MMAKYFCNLLPMHGTFRANDDAVGGPITWPRRAWFGGRVLLSVFSVLKILLLQLSRFCKQYGLQTCQRLSALQLVLYGNY